MLGNLGFGEPRFTGYQRQDVVCKRHARKDTRSGFAMVASRASVLCLRKTGSVSIWRKNRLIVGHDGRADISLIEPGCLSLFKSKIRVEVENAPLRHRLTVLQRKTRSASNSRTAIGCSLSCCIVGFRRFSRLKTIIRPETLVRWHRAGPAMGGRLQVSPEVRALIRRMSIESRLWGTLRIHGELL
jgi:hypothetical protein